jgi:hypothetical protein
MHTLPHEPQFDVLVWRSTHDPLHSFVPGAQPTLHVPEAHTCPVVQAFAQSPQ